MNSHMQAYLENVGKAPAMYVIERHKQVLQDLARSGNVEYKTELARIEGDMPLSYSVLPEKKLSAYEYQKAISDADYVLFHEKDAKKYVEMKNRYFNEMGEDVTELDYGVAAQTLYQAMGSKIPQDVQLQLRKWIETALTFPKLNLMNKVNFLVMLGDNYRDLHDYAHAKEYYNQAFMESIQMEQEMTKAMIQMRIKQKLAALDLIK